jgi:hypothetical protein
MSAASATHLPRTVATGMLAFALVSIVDLASAILRIGSGGWHCGWHFWPFWDAACLAVMLLLFRRRHPLVPTCMRAYGITAFVLGAIELVSRTALYRWNGALTASLALVGLLAMTRPSARAYFARPLAGGSAS